MSARRQNLALYKRCELAPVRLPGLVILYRDVPVTNKAYIDAGFIQAIFAAVDSYNNLPNKQPIEAVISEAYLQPEDYKYGTTVTFQAETKSFMLNGEPMTYNRVMTEPQLASLALHLFNEGLASSEIVNQFRQNKSPRSSSISSRHR